MNNNFFIYEAVSNPKTTLDFSFLKNFSLNYFPEQLYYSQLSSQDTTSENPYYIDFGSKRATSPSYSSSSSPKMADYSRGSKGEYRSLWDLIQLEELPIIVTSSFREGSRKSNHSKRDSHGNPLAYDIVPMEGYTFDDLRKIFYENPKVVKWFNDNNYGILEEAMDGKPGFYDVKGVFHQTRATGPHFHIGPDSKGVENYRAKVKLPKAAKGMKVPLALDYLDDYTLNDSVPFFKYEYVNNPKPVIQTDLFGDIDLSDNFVGISDSGIPIAKSNLNTTEDYIDFSLTTNNPTTSYSISPSSLSTLSKGYDLLSFHSLDVNAFKKYASGDYLHNINNNIKHRTIDFNNIPKNFINTLTPIAELTGVPLGFFIMIAKSESGFRNLKPNNEGYGGYFGLSVKNGVGYDKSLAQLAIGVVLSYNAAKRASPGASPKDLLTLGYIYHHLPAVGSKYWKYTNGNIYTLNPDLIYKNIISCYKGGSRTRYAEAIAINVCALYMAELIALHPELMN